MSIHLQLDLAANEIVSLGRQITRCYKQRNAAEFRGHVPGSLECRRAVATSRGGVQRYLIELVEVEPVTQLPRQERVDFTVFERGEEIDPPAAGSTKLGLPTLSRVPSESAPGTEGEAHG